MRLPERGDTVRTGGRQKVAPDPQTRAAFVTAATEVIRAEGVQAVSVAQLLSRTNSSTRAFYRHFDSKDQLIAAVFLEMAHAEVARLEQRMSDGRDPVGAVAAWIDGRLDIAFNTQIRSDLRQMSLEAQTQMFVAPEVVAPAYREILRPLVEQLARGKDLGVFQEIDPDGAALSIHGVVWANVERHWATAARDPKELRDRVRRFCLGGLGLTSEVISAAVADEQNRRGRGSSR
ncbi:MAG TPA: TetR/AcrR family transcriptional regulator [Mycobacterium sp.]|jgi:AcrR family transcriptional regulator|uniref:TetR/AcrR family transcriptional regulator n=1 Tax=Mycobacterium sp. TaxID=1785 RepID=UPI002F3FAFAF